MSDERYIQPTLDALALQVQGAAAPDRHADEHAHGCAAGAIRSRWPRTAASASAA